MRYETIKDFQYTDDKGQIMLLIVNSKLTKYDEEWFIFSVGNKEYQIPSLIVMNNPSYFKPVDWREDLYDYMRKNKRSTPKAIHKQVVDFLDNEVLFEKEVVDYTTLRKMLELVRSKYYEDNQKEWIDIFNTLGWSFDEVKIYKKY